MGYTVKAKDAPEPVECILFIHPCWIPDCPAEAPHGRGVYLLRNKPGLWSCPEHLADLEAYLAGLTQNKTNPSNLAKSTTGVGNGEQQDVGGPGGDLFGD